MTMELNSQICTTREQSVRLMDLGLKCETADCYLEYVGRDNYGNNVWHPSTIVNNYRMPDYSRDFPAWSLHRLLDMMPSTIQDLYELDFSKRGVYYADFSNGSFNFIQSFAKPAKILYDNIINCIEWLIKEGYFNKEYLKE